MTPLTPDEIRAKIIEYCLEQNGIYTMSDVYVLEAKIIGLCIALGADETEPLGSKLLESIGIKVKQVNPDWEFY